MTYNKYEDISVDNPLPVQEAEGTYNRGENVSLTNPYPVMQVDVEEYSKYFDVSEDNPQPIAVVEGGSYTRGEDVSDDNPLPVKFIEGQHYSKYDEISEVNPWPVLNTTVGGGAYNGPLDEVPGAVLALSQFAPAASYIGQPYATIRSSGGGDPEVFNFAADGSPPSANINTFLDGNDGFVAEWSGGPLAATQATSALQPQWVSNSFNGVPSFTFDGTQLLTTASATFATGEFTIFAVVNSDTILAGSKAIVGMNNNLYEPPDGVLSLYLDVTTLVNSYASSDQGNEQNGGFSDTVAALFGNNILIDIAWSTAGGSIRINGVDVGFTNNSVGTVGSMSGPLAIGNDDAVDPLVASFFVGKIAALIMYDSRLSAPNLALVREKLASQYNITLP